MASILDVLNKEQREACEKIDGPVLVFAGAGTGKTRTLTARIAYMVEEKAINPYNILAITFTKKATNEMRERLYGILEDSAKQLNISTIHSLCVKILRRDIDRIGYKLNFEIIDEDDSQRILNDILKRQDVDKKQFTGKACSIQISNYKNGLCKLDGILNDVYLAYEENLKTNNFLDFDDLLIKTVELFNTCPEVLAYYQDFFKYVLVDEFQDVNNIQYKFIKMIADKHRNLFVVGDDDQSIYSFRGACPDIMINFKNEYKDALIVKLTQNYRSHNSILKGANQVISKNTIRENKELYSTVEGSDADVVVQEAFYYEDEVRYVVNEIAHLVSSKKYRYSDICILYRNSALSRNFEIEFLAQHIPYAIFGGFSYLKRREVKDIISYMRFIVDPNRITHFKRIINIPSRGIGEKTINKVATVMEEDNLSLYDAIEQIYNENPSTKNTSLLEFKKLMVDLEEKVETMNLLEFFDYLVEKTGYSKLIQEEDLNNDSERFKNLLEFKSILATIEASFDSSYTQKEKIRMGIDEIMLDQSFEDEGKKDAVTLSTVHSVKGLEFEVVFVVALEEGIFPTIKEGAEIEEERRVAYVAFTRAKSKIYLTCARKRLIYGRMVQNKMSRFLREYLSCEDVRPSQPESTDRSDSTAELKAGVRVNHKYFGYGQVISVDKDLAQIVFEKDNTIKTIKKDYPNMKIIG